MPDKFCPYCMEQLGENGLCRACGRNADSYQPAAHCLPAGTVLAQRYAVGSVLGEGGFGITYIGLDLRLDLRVAVKEFFPVGKAVRLAEDGKTALPGGSITAQQEFETCKGRFLQEARRMARMEKRPEIVGVKDFFEENGTAYIVMEYIAGVTLKQLIAEQGPLEAEYALKLFHPLFPALSALHESGLLHRDISPDNLILENGVLRLLDFGCAREVIPGDYTMTISLKHGFAPIEQYQSRSGGQGPWTDVYGLAATLYYCLCGEAPDHALDRLCKDRLTYSRDKLSQPKSHGVPLDEQQEKALLHGMALIPNRRFQSIEEFEKALYKQESKAKPRRKTAAIVTGGTVVFLLLAALAVSLFSGNAAPPPKASSAPTFSSSAPSRLDSQTESGMESGGEDLPSREELIAAIGGEGQSLWDETSQTVSTTEQLLSALADTNVPSVIVDTDDFLRIGVSDLPVTTITKPVLVRRGAMFVYTPVEVAGENALLCTEEGASLDIRGYLRTSQGGWLYNGEGGNVSLWAPAIVERSADLGGTLDWKGSLTLNEPAVRERAVSLKSEAELAAALENADTKAVILAEDMELTGSYSCPVPVIVEPSVTVTISGELTAQNGGFTNYGAIQGRGRLQLEGQEDSVSMNYGKIAVSGLSLVNRSSLFNAGNIGGCRISAGPFTYFANCGALWFETLEEEIHEIVGGFWNCGPVDVYGSVSVNRMQDVLAPIQIHKGGVLRATAGFSIESAELFVYAGGTFINETLFRNHGATVHLEEGGVFQNDSPASVVFNAYGNTGAFLDAEIGGVVRSCRSLDDTEDTLRISTEEELRQAQQGDPRKLVVLEAPVTLSEDIVILRDMRIEPGAKLLGSGVTVTLDGAYVSAFGESIEASHVALENGAFLECGWLTITDPQGSLEIGLNGEATLYSDSIAVNQASIRTGPGGIFLVREINDCSKMTVGGRVYLSDQMVRGDSGNFTVEDIEIAGGQLYLINEAPVNYGQPGDSRAGGTERPLNETPVNNGQPVHVQVGENGVLKVIGAYAFSQGSMEIAETGQLLTGPYSLSRFDTDFYLMNRGTVTVENIEVCPVTLNGIFTNNGMLRLESERPGFLISGTLSNQGTVSALIPEPFTFEGTGVLTGSGEVLLQ